MLYNEIIAVTNRKLVKGDFYAKIRELCELGVKAIILREKDLSQAEYEKLARNTLSICESKQVKCILHSYYNVAISLKCRNIHMPINILSDIYKSNPDKLKCFEEIGVSVHSVEESVSAQTMGAAYITFGHVFATACKQGIKPRGINLLNEVCSAVNIPVYGIGGVDESNYESIVMAGAKGACIMSGLMKT